MYTFVYMQEKMIHAMSIKAYKTQNQESHSYIYM